MNTAELHRRLENLIRLGTVKTITPSQPYSTVTVQIGDIETAELRFFSLRAGKDKSWHPPSIGEEVIVFAPSGVLEIGVVLCGLNNEKFPAPSVSLDQHLHSYEDGCRISYNVSRHELNAELPAAGRAVITAPGGFTVNADSVFNGNVTINGSQVTTGNSTVQGSQLVQGSTHSVGPVSTDADIIAGLITLLTHLTSGVRSGGDISGGPVP